MKGCTREGNRLRLGANVTFADFLDDPTLRALLPVMPSTVFVIGAAASFSKDPYPWRIRSPPL